MVKKSNADPIGNAGVTAEYVQLNHRANPLSVDGANQLRNKQRALGLGNSATGIKPGMHLHLRERAGPLQLIEETRFNGKTDLIAGIDQPQINHQRYFEAGKSRINPITSIGGSLPTGLSHGITRLEIIDQIESRFDLGGKHQIVFRNRLQALDRGSRLIESGCSSNQPTFSQSHVLARVVMANLVPEGLIGLLVFGLFLFVRLSIHFHLPRDLTN
jgi:hypothetical protein